MRIIGTQKAPWGHFLPSAVLATDVANNYVLALLLVQETTGWQLESCILHTAKHTGCCSREEKMEHLDVSSQKDTQVAEDVSFQRHTRAQPARWTTQSCFFLSYTANKRFNQNLKRSDQSASARASQSPAGRSQAGTARCTWGTPSSDFPRAPQTCSDHS
ncbi:hypothetical protein Anapl_17764 [Anas platyrhynchos]|uniref:Uncharacterized protein n=1 Tax=Anas platyrhynchos TaxID=8839 RepID=R0KKD0_ANAPL|nr:hypothetical protein Anapl_17764 [Anas platyrhynchos]